MMNKFQKISITIFVLLFAVIAIPNLMTGIIHAEVKDDLQSKIDQKNKDIEALHVEITSLSKQIDTLGSQANTLAGTIKSLELTRKKLEANISITQDKIIAKNYEIEKLGTQISGKVSNIEEDKRIILKTFASIQELDNQSIIEMILTSGSLSEIWNSTEQLSTLQKNLYSRIDSLGKDKSNLETNKVASEKAKNELLALKEDLGDQQKITASTIKEQNALLKQTNQSEASYKKTLATKKAQEEAFQAEINSYESQLKLLTNPELIPHTGSGILLWPVDSATSKTGCAKLEHCITQYFGNTDFATANPQVYNGKGHTGIDFRAPIGTPIKSALSGTVIAVYNMDATPGCLSYGKWIMIDHHNGLSTLYGHMSLQTATVGQEVSVGERIGYSGNTGYSTGPHLHFGVYATQGVQIKKMVSKTPCNGATYPYADYNAYLNPLSYL